MATARSIWPPVVVTGNTVTILLGNGDGTFTAAPSQTQLVASKLVVADFNGDGKIDLATLDSVGGTLAVLLGIGDGTFNAPTPLPADSNFSASTLAVGDFNGDGKPDVAVTAAANTASITPDAKVSIFAGNGDGTFGARSDVGFNVVTGAIGLTSLAAADLTGSGSSDLATFGSVFLGNLTITTATANYVLPFGDSMIQADYPGDANNAPSNSTNGPAVFVPQQSFSLTSNPVTVTPGASASGNFSVTSLTFSRYLELELLDPGSAGPGKSPGVLGAADRIFLLPRRNGESGLYRQHAGHNSARSIHCNHHGHVRFWRRDPGFHLCHSHGGRSELSPDQ